MLTRLFSASSLPRGTPAVWRAAWARDVGRPASVALTRMAMTSIITEKFRERLKPVLFIMILLQLQNRIDLLLSAVLQIGAGQPDVVGLAGVYVWNVTGSLSRWRASSWSASSGRWC